MWNYDASQFKERSYEPIPVGNYRVRIKEASIETSKNSGNNMIKLEFEVSGHRGVLFYYIPLMPDKPEMTNQKLGEIFDSFGIKPGDMNTLGWRGKVGAAKIKHEIYNGNPQARVHFIILKSKQGDLPAWVEPVHPGAGTANGIYSMGGGVPEVESLRDAAGFADTPF